MPAGTANRIPHAPVADTHLRPVRAFAGTAVIVGGIFLTTWAYLSWKDKRAHDGSHAGSVPGWKHRYAQVATNNNYVGADQVTPLRRDIDERKTNGAGPQVENNRDQHNLTGLRVGDIKRDPNGGPMHPTPQRAHATAAGLAYTKKVTTPVALKGQDVMDVAKEDVSN
ncbi:uncharacterized protein STEHIDRAFT_157417 [Stereum hirsutum FP-91666 SS1]|uniref:uncharacterized protein n=1 Tax=Stereum hirsutum (strain FP-91666) TaxID=721885 RepID=UPI00044492B7|nr:uncharacterized protein STEHIDRAFT_157417 [Stereum hirsutum FP-91666 SS1]EIM85885.1 hypothetical protein STEHIDRAFT_157417 [Stereum hirsutum FP-91666 SS1]